jgi:hypothetical protein
MLASSALYKQYIHAPNQLAFQADLYSGDGTVLERDVPVLGGVVTANLTHRVTRTVNFSLGPEWWPEDETDPLSPFQSFVSIRGGARYGDGSTELFPLFTGRVADVSRADTGEVRVRADDLAADVIGYHFEQPRNSENVTVVNQAERLIREVFPLAVFGPHDVTDAPCPKLTWDEDRGKALDDLMEALGARWYCLGDGSFVFRQYPYDVGTVVQEIRDGPGGLLVSGTPSLSRDGFANSITVVVERFDGGAPFRVTARDTGLTSPTRFGGPAGTVAPAPIKIQTPMTLGQATDYARAQLNASLALASRWGVAMQPDYTLEPGDTVRLESRGIRSTQLIDTITYPLAQPATMALGTRAYVRAQASV